jgi:hypothetical protein
MENGKVEKIDKKPLNTVKTGLLFFDSLSPLVKRTRKQLFQKLQTQSNRNDDAIRKKTESCSLSKYKAKFEIICFFVVNFMHFHFYLKTIRVAIFISFSIRVDRKFIMALIISNKERNFHSSKNSFTVLCN